MSDGAPMSDFSDGCQSDGPRPGAGRKISQNPPSDDSDVDGGQSDDQARSGSPDAHHTVTIRRPSVSSETKYSSD